MTKIQANLVFQACISFLGVLGIGIEGNVGNFLSRFAGLCLICEVFQTRVAHFCFCLVCMEMPLVLRVIGHMLLGKT